MISARTKEALAQAKARGVRLGNPRLREVSAKGAESMKAAADRFAANVLPLIQPLRAEGKSLREIASGPGRAWRADGARREMGGAQIAEILSADDTRSLISPRTERGQQVSPGPRNAQIRQVHRSV